MDVGIGKSRSPRKRIDRVCFLLFVLYSFFFLIRAVSQEGMAPRDILQSATDCNIRRSIQTICDDIAKKARTSRQNMWESIFRFRATGTPPEIEPSK